MTVVVVGSVGGNGGSVVFCVADLGGGGVGCGGAVAEEAIVGASAVVWGEWGDVVVEVAGSDVVVVVIGGDPLELVNDGGTTIGT